MGEIKLNQLNPDGTDSVVVDSGVYNAVCNI